MAKAKKAKAAVTGSVVNKKYQDGRYEVTKTKTAGGKRFAVDVGDTVAKKLRGLSIADMGKVARENGLGDRFRDKWSKLNPGLCRMALGNSLRGLNKPKKAAKAKKTKAA